MNQQTTNRDTGEAAATNAPANSATSTSTPDNQPTPLDAFEVLLITGMSGAGRSHAADCVEDMGWYVVDNLPPKLLIPLVDMMTTSGSGSESGVHKLAAVIDVRSSYFDELAAVLGHLDDLGVKTRILFLDASNEVLIKRYESVRRPHPLQHGNRLIDGILEERHLLEDLKERADWVIDTSSLSIHQLSTKLYEAMLGSGPTTVAVLVFEHLFHIGVGFFGDFFFRRLAVFLDFFILFINVCRFFYIRPFFCAFFPLFHIGKSGGIGENIAQRLVAVENLFEFFYHIFTAATTRSLPDISLNTFAVKPFSSKRFFTASPCSTPISASTTPPSNKRGLDCVAILR